MRRWRSPEREAQERLAEIARLESELARLREAMVETEREALQGESAATALRNEIATLREAIGRAEQEGKVRAAEVARLGREIDGLRATVTRAECDAAAMQSALVAARQIGRAAIDALAMGKLAPLDRPPGLGWRQALRRRFALPAARE
jgi:chromosome segregation ATPase